MSENTDAANAFIHDLRRQREKYGDFVRDEVEPLFHNNDQRERKPPTHFVDSSFLYIRSYDGDSGARPFANQVFWLSPDIRVSPITNLAAYTQTLNAGETYALTCAVRNRGDLGVPSAKVEFWLTDPSLGFDTRYATHLTLGRVPATWVSAYGSGQVTVPYTVPPTESGHKCLFARVFSFSPLDLPLDDFCLDPPLDRHIGQLNLNIVAQGQAFVFNAIHQPNAEWAIQFVPLAAEELLALRHPVLADVTPAREVPREGWTERTRLELADSDARAVDIGRENDRVFLFANDPEGADLGTQRDLRRMVRDALAEIDAGKARPADHRDLFAKFRDVNRGARRSIFKMEAPDLGLGRGQAAAVHIRATDRELGDHDAALGGITLLIVG
jgi:hypothetical protein